MNNGEVSGLLGQMRSSYDSLNRAWTNRRRDSLTRDTDEVIRAAKEVDGCFLEADKETRRRVTAAAWLIQQSAAHVAEYSADGSQDWDRVGAALAFLESGIDQLHEAAQG
jgi:hypothetical protein